MGQPTAKGLSQRRLAIVIGLIVMGETFQLNTRYNRYE